MIAFAAPTIDFAGRLVLPIRPDNPFHGERRGTVTATLDGGSYPYDAGYSISDQTIRSTLRNPTRAQLVALQYLVSHYPQMVVCTETGAYSAVVKFTVKGAVCAIEIRPISQLSA